MCSASRSLASTVCSLRAWSRASRRRPPTSTSGPRRSLPRRVSRVSLTRRPSWPSPRSALPSSGPTCRLTSGRVDESDILHLWVPRYCSFQADWNGCEYSQLVDVPCPLYKPTHRSEHRLSPRRIQTFANKSILPLCKLQ